MAYQRKVYYPPVQGQFTFSESSSAQSKPLHPLNQILFGTPGTGKTFMTRAYAVAICNNRPLGEDYAAIKAEYDDLITDGHIKFVTFHQSYGYEDFIEGLKPEVVDGNISYRVASGVFKKFCERAKNSPTDNSVFIIDEINCRKNSLSRKIFT